MLIENCYCRLPEQGHPIAHSRHTYAARVCPMLVERASTQERIPLELWLYEVEDPGEIAKLRFLNGIGASPAISSL